MDRTDFSAMADSTREDWSRIVAAGEPFRRELPERIIAHLKLLDGECGGFPIDRLEHSLQTATRAHRAGESETYVVCALLHDVGDILASANHPDIAAAILKPYVSDELHWMVAQHGIFQGYYFFHHLGLDRDMRDRFRGHPSFELTALFCERYDQNSFDENYDTMPLEAFLPMCGRVFAQPRQSIYLAE